MFAKKLRDMGVDKKLRELGVKNKDTVCIFWLCIWIYRLKK